MFRLIRMSSQSLDLLKAFIAEPGDWRYGYDLSRETTLKSGTLYPILIRLNNRGWLETRWSQPEGPGRPPRHMYRLTPDGLRCAREAFSAKAASVPSRRVYGTGSV